MSVSQSAVGVVKFLGVALACVACAVTSTVARAEPTPCSVDSQVLALLISVRSSDEAQRFPYLLMDVQEVGDDGFFWSPSSTIVGGKHEVVL